MNGHAKEAHYYGWTSGLGVLENAACVLCTSGSSETRNHLFFDCSYFSSVRVKNLRKNQVLRSPYPWDEEKEWFLLH